MISVHMVEIGIHDFHDKNRVGLFKRGAYFGFQDVHQLFKLTKNLRAHAIGMDNDAVILIQSFDKRFDWGNIRRIQWIIADFDRGFHFSYF